MHYIYIYVCKINIYLTHPRQYITHTHTHTHNDDDNNDAVATAEDSPLATKLKKTWLRTPVSEEQAAQAVLDPSIGTKCQNINRTFSIGNA